MTPSNTAPVISSPTAVGVIENSVGAVYTATATDPDAGTTLTYSLSGADAALFDIDPTTGEVFFKQSPDFETPRDADGDNVYDVKVTASDGTNATTQDVAITVTNSNEGPTITSAASATVAENATGTVYTATATDPDAGTTLTYSLSGADAALFNINAQTGAISFKQRPDYENANDAGGDNIYDVKVTASDGTNATTQDVAITVTNSNEGPAITSAASATVAENATGTVYTATATDPDAGTTLTYSLSGADAALFDINAQTGAISFKQGPDYENASDAGGDNIYDVKVTASDGTNATTQDVAITVSNSNEGPAITSAASATVAENATGTVYTATATDPDAGTTLSYSLSGADAALFDINATTGAISFKSAPNYEAPADTGGDNIYDVKVTASDGTSVATKDVAISVANANEGPSLSVSGGAVVSVIAASEFETGNGANGYTTSNANTLDGWTLKSGDGFQTVGSNFYGTNNAGHGNALDMAVEGADVTIQRDFSGLEPNRPYVFTVRASSGGPDGAPVIDDNGISVTINGVTSTIAAADLVKGYQTFTFAFTSDANGNAHIEVAGTDQTADGQAAYIDTLAVLKGTASTFSPLLEGAANGTVVGAASATDPDAADNLTYSLADNAGGRFAIDPKTGVITVADGSKLNYEASASHTIAVKVTDAGGLSSQQSVTIAIADKPPVFIGNGTAYITKVQQQFSNTFLFYFFLLFVCVYSSGYVLLLVAAAFDERIALCIPSQAGCGGTAPNRVAAEWAALQANGRPKAETVAVINKNFPHWFCANFKAFNDQTERLPFDQHALVALCAPRPVLMSCATEDLWSNPPGQFAMLQAADPVYRLLAGDGVGASEMPAVGKLLDSRLGYFIRAGKHSMTREDWGAWLDYAGKWLR